MDIELGILLLELAYLRLKLGTFRTTSAVEEV